MLGWSLVLYGLLGLGIVLGGAVVGLDVAARVERLASAAGGTLDAAARSTEAASDAFTNVDASLAESQVSAEGAADLALEASGTLDSLSRAMELSVFGAQPLLPLASEFADSADQAALLAETLDSVAASLDETRGDVSAHRRRARPAREPAGDPAGVDRLRRRRSTDPPLRDAPAGVAPRARRGWRDRGAGSPASRSSAHRDALDQSAVRMTRRRRSSETT